MALSGTFYGTTANERITPKIVWSATQSITGNYSTVTATLYYSRTNTGYTTGGTWSGSITINGTTTSSSSRFNITYNSNTKAMSATVKVPHNDDGTKTITISAAGKMPDTTLTSTSISASVTLDTIPRKSSLSASNGTLGTAQTLIVDRKASSFTHTITYKCGSGSGTVCTKSSSTSINFTPPLALASQNTTGTSVSVVFTITTYSGSTSIGSNTKTITCAIPASVKPSCKVTVTDPTGHATTYGGYIKGISKFQVTVTPTLAYSSPIASYKTTANGSTYTAASFTTAVVKSSGTLTISATVTDKRGRSGSATASAVVLNYAAPNITKLTVRRCDEDGTENDQGEYVQVTFSATVTGLSSKNSAAYVLKYKKTSETVYTTVTMSDFANTYTVTNATYMFTADSGSSYDVVLTVTDDFKTTKSSTTASTAFTLMHWSKGGTGMGIGKIAEAENLLDIGIPVRFRAGAVNNVLWSGGRYMTADHTAELSQPISKQVSGIVLVFSAYEDGAAQNHHFESCFIPKYLVSAMDGGGHNCKLCTSDFSYVGTKYLYISDNKITGHANNSKTGTNNGVTYANNHWVLRYVIGV